LESASKLKPPYDYFTFVELANTNKSLTNSSYSQLLLKVLSKASISNTNNIISAMNKFKNRKVVNSAFNKSYVDYWNARFTAANITSLREESTNIIKEVQDNVLGYIKKRVST
ncbi:hypothetical protein K501DRAFT_307618, partial [Backusella circina FSU 941]